MNPGISPYPAGLFWTMPIPDESVTVNPGAGQGVYQVENANMQDFGDFDTALSGLPGVPATVSFEVRWSGVGQRVNIQDPEANFSAEFVRGQAQMSWSAAVGTYLFQSDPLGTSSSDFAEIGVMRNGSFHPR